MPLDRMSVLSAVMEQGVVPVFYHPDIDVCKSVIQACSNAGVKCIEFTNRGDFAPRAFADLALHFSKIDPSVILGVGSIVDAPTAAIFVANGARFVVSPLLSAEVARFCNRRKIPYMPGCGSLTEIGEAEELGCEIVKMFPGSSVGGADFVKAVMGPCPWTRIMPTGGVDATEASLKKWFDAGVCCVGMGSNLISQAMLEKKDYKGIESKIKETIALVKSVRGK